MEVALRDNWIYFGKLTQTGFHCPLTPSTFPPPLTVPLLICRCPSPGFPASLCFLFYALLCLSSHRREIIKCLLFWVCLISLSVVATVPPIFLQMHFILPMTNIPFCMFSTFSSSTCLLLGSWATVTVSCYRLWCCPDDCTWIMMTLL